MNLRSGVTAEKITLPSRKRTNKQFASPVPTMAEVGAIKHLMLEMKEAISKEIKDFRMDFNTFRADKDIKKIMQLTTELRTDQTKTSDRVDQVELRVGEMHNTEILHQQSIKYLVNKISEMEERNDYAKECAYIQHTREK